MATRFSGGHTPLHYTPGEKRVKPNVTFHEEVRRVTGLPGFLREALMGRDNFEDSRILNSVRSQSRQKRLEELRQRKMQARLNAPPKESGEDLTPQEIARYRFKLLKETTSSQTARTQQRSQAFDRLVSRLPPTAITDPMGFILRSAVIEHRSIPELQEIFSWNIPTTEIRRALSAKPFQPPSDQRGHLQPSETQKGGYEEVEWRERVPRLRTKNFLLPSRFHQPPRACETCRGHYRVTSTDRALTSLSLLSFSEDMQ